MPNENTIFINLASDRYTELLKTEVIYSTLVDALLGSADLNYSKKGLSFRDDTISTMLNIVAPDKTKNRLAELQAAKEEE